MRPIILPILISLFPHISHAGLNEDLPPSTITIAPLPPIAPASGERNGGLVLPMNETFYHVQEGDVVYIESDDDDFVEVDLNEGGANGEDIIPASQLDQLVENVHGDLANARNPSAELDDILEKLKGERTSEEEERTASNDSQRTLRHESQDTSASSSKNNETTIWIAIERGTLTIRSLDKLDEDRVKRFLENLSSKISSANIIQVKIIVSEFFINYAESILKGIFALCPDVTRLSIEGGMMYNKEHAGGLLKNIAAAAKGFPKITALHLNSFFAEGIPVESIKDFSNIKSLEIGSSYFVFSENTKVDLLPLKKLNKVIFNDIAHFIHGNIKKSTLFNNVTHLKIIYNTKNKNMENRCLTRAAECFPNITSLHLNNFNDGIPVESIQGFSNLRSLKMENSYFIFPKNAEAVLLPLKKLNTVILEDTIPITHGNLQKSPLFNNVTHLKITYCGQNMANRCLSLTAECFPNITSLHLNNFNDGIPVEYIENFLKLADLEIENSHFVFTKNKLATSFTSHTLKKLIFDDITSFLSLTPQKSPFFDNITELVIGDLTIPSQENTRQCLTLAAEYFPNTTSLYLENIGGISLEILEKFSHLTNLDLNNCYLIFPELNDFTKIKIKKLAIHNFIKTITSDNKTKYTFGKTLKEITTSDNQTPKGEFIKISELGKRAKKTIISDNQTQTRQVITKGMQSELISLLLHIPSLETLVLPEVEETTERKILSYILQMRRIGISNLQYVQFPTRDGYVSYAIVEDPKHPGKYTTDQQIVRTI